MKNFIFLVVLASVADFLVLAAPEKDEVTELPGLSWKPDFKHYSGYLNDAPNGSIHYWMVESASNPSKDPLVLWMNDGVGCSSMIGMMAEHGPFSLQQDGKTIKKNPYSWNANANVIYLEVPAQTGFSHHKGAIGDVETGRAIYVAMKKFYKKFPEYKANDLYMAVEGYSSVYAFYAENFFTGNPLFQHFKGYVMYQASYPYNFYFNGLIYSAFFRGYIGRQQFNKALQGCCQTLDTSSCDFEVSSTIGKCQNALKPITDLMWNKVNQYNYVLPAPGETASTNECLERKLDYMTAYFRQSSVIQALHVNPDKKWLPKNVAPDYKYDGRDEDLERHFRKAIITKRVLMMYGDQSSKANSLGAERYLFSLKLKQIGYRDYWGYVQPDGIEQIGGANLTYGNTYFYTFIGAGQRIAEDAPVQAFSVFDYFIRGLK